MVQATAGDVRLGAYSRSRALARWLPMGAMAAAGGHDRRLEEIIALFPRLGLVPYALTCLGALVVGLGVGGVQTFRYLRRL